ncbi:MAG: type toxin-antitoxin system RelE/ParE family toxin [Flavipsychrobacter sp.]|jgi:hypothetical protein|nr:type toxin-antitoxin system RelE/ParE family toxin [Flavipsychrobacter sp.]
MEYNITLSDDAEDDIFTAYIWYEQQKQGLGDEFKNAVKNAVTSIKLNPLYFSYRRKNTRGYIVKGFPYIVLFYIKRNNIYVNAVFHMSRKRK